MHYVYILQCSDASYYVGLTHDVVQRFEVHSSGGGPAYTASRLPVRLVYQEPVAALEEAVRREKQIKGWSRAKKEALIARDFALLSRLATSKANVKKI